MARPNRLLSGSLFVVPGLVGHNPAWRCNTVDAAITRFSDRVQRCVVSG
jgi:hypothetical protein